MSELQRLAQAAENAATALRDASIRCIRATQAKEVADKNYLKGDARDLNGLMAIADGADRAAVEAQIDFLTAKTEYDIAAQRLTVYNAATYHMDMITVASNKDAYDKVAAAVLRLAEALDGNAPYAK